jgi:hypothetical protein
MSSKNQVGHHGDVFLLKVDDQPRIPRKSKNTVEITQTNGQVNVLQHGEALGHYHVIPGDENKVRVFLHKDPTNVQRILTLVVTEPVALTHEEHKPVNLLPGTYVSKSKREWSDSGIRGVLD